MLVWVNLGKLSTFVTKSDNTECFNLYIQSSRSNISILVLRMILFLKYPTPPVLFQTFRIKPPMCITKDDADFFLAVFNQAVLNYMERR